MGLIIFAVGVLLLAAFLWLKARRAGGLPRPHEASEFPRLAAEMKARATPTLLMWPTENETRNRIGGSPDLDEAAAWAEDQGRRHAFLAQFDLASVRAAGGPEWLPDKGALFIFVRADDKGELDDLEDPLRVVWRPGFGDGATLNGPIPYPSRRIAFDPRQSRPAVDILADLPTMNVTGRELDQLTALQFEPYEGEPTNGYGDTVTSRIGGSPDPIQTQHWQMECEAASRGLDERAAYAEPPDPDIVAASGGWRMLAQFATDPRLGLDWPASGTMYLYIREADARAGDFSKTHSIWQGY